MELPSSEFHVVDSTVIIRFDQSRFSRMQGMAVAATQEWLLSLARQHGCRTVALDVSEIEILCSSVLGMLASLRADGIAVQLYNPSEYVQEVLDVTRLDMILSVRFVAPERLQHFWRQVS